MRRTWRCRASTRSPSEWVWVAGRKSDSARKGLCIDRGNTNVCKANGEACAPQGNPHGPRDNPAMSVPRSRLTLYLDLIRWDRPAGWLLLRWPTLSALWIAADGFPGLLLLVVTTNPPTILLSLPALAVAIAYPWGKRVVAMPQAVLGVAFSFGIPMAFAAVLGGREWSLAAIGAAVPWQAWGLMAANMFWVLGYDTEYAMVDRDDDLKVGIKTSAITLGRWDVVGVMAFYGVFLLGWGALAHGLGLSRWAWLGLAVAALQAAWHWTMIRDRSREGCFRAFRLNHWLGAAVFAGTVIATL